MVSPTSKRAPIAQTQSGTTNLPRNPLFSQHAFAGKVYVITGAAHGIGEATARGLAALGAAVVLIDTNKLNLSYVEEDLLAAGAPHISVVGDITRDSVLKRTIERTIKKFGRIDGWVNNAMLNAGGLVDEQSSEDYERGWEVNIRAAWMATRLITPILIAQGDGGAIVNISSVMAYHTRPTQSSYTSTKSGLNGLTRALACELAPHHIRVNTIMPGTIYTGSAAQAIRRGASKKLAEYGDKLVNFAYSRAQPLRRVGKPDNIANTVIFLLSSAAAFINGTTVTVDGGMTVGLPPSIWDDGSTAFTQQVKRMRKTYDRLAKQEKRQSAAAGKGRSQRKKST